MNKNLRACDIAVQKELAEKQWAAPPVEELAEEELAAVAGGGLFDRLSRLYGIF